MRLVLFILLLSFGLLSCSKDESDIQGTWHTSIDGQATYPHVVFNQGSVRIITSESGTGWSGQYNISKSNIIFKQDGSSGSYRFSFELSDNELYMKNISDATLFFPYHEFRLKR